MTPYHFDPDPTRWDHRTLAFDAKGGVLPPPYPSSIPLLRAQYKIDFMKRVGSVLGAQVVANGLPMTRSYVQAQLSSSAPTIHFTETSQQVCTSSPRIPFKHIVWRLRYS